MIYVAPTSEEKPDFLERITTFASNVIGSWWMICAQTVGIIIWVIVDRYFWNFDTPKLDWLRLTLTFQSLYASPLILMASRRAAKRDRKVLHDLDEHEHKAMELRLEAMERRIRLEEKVDKLLTKMGE